MNNEQLAPKVRAWLEDTDLGPEDVRRSVGIVSGRARAVRPRGRWWPLPSLRRRTWLPAVSSDPPPAPIPVVAMHGQTPTAIGRIQLMLSPAKLIVAGAIVVLFAGLLSSGVLVPAAPTTLAPGAGASLVPSNALLEENEFTGKLVIDGGVTGEAGRGIIRYRYRTEEMTDPRLEGEWVLDYTQSIVDFGDSLEALYNASFRMQNEEGAWQEEPNLTLEYPDGTASSRTSALVGEGAYAGLTAVAELTYVPQGHFDIHGVITDVPIPEAPDAVPTDQ